MKRVICWSALFLLAGSLAAAAQTIKVPESWDRLAATADEVVKINLDRRMLQFAGRYLDNSPGEAKAKQTISRLNGIVVRSLEFKRAGAYTEADVEPLRRQFQTSEWSQIVDVDSKKDKEKVEIYLRMSEDRVLGMVILAQEPTELTLVHLDGDIDPEALGDLGGSFGIPKGIHAHSKKGDATPAGKPAPAVPR